MKKLTLIFLLICVLVFALVFHKNFTIVKRNHSEPLVTKENKVEAEVTDDKNMHPIEIKVQKCMKEKNYTTSGMILCVDSSHKDWYREIDKNMELLKQVFPEDEYALLEISQKEWIEYKNQELKTIGTIFGFGPPEMVRFFRSGEQAGILEDRAKALGGYYEMYNDYK